MPFFQYLQLIISDTYLQLYSLSLLTSKQILKSFVLSFHKFLILHYPKNYFDKLNVSRWWKGETLVHLKSYSEWKKNWKFSFMEKIFRVIIIFLLFTIPRKKLLKNCFLFFLFSFSRWQNQHKNFFVLLCFSWNCFVIWN